MALIGAATNRKRSGSDASCSSTTNDQPPKLAVPNAVWMSATEYVPLPLTSEVTSA